MPSSENPRRPAGRRSRSFLPGLVGDRVAARLRRRRGPVAAATEPLETRLLLAAAPIDTLAYDADARESKQWIYAARDNYMVQTFTVEEPSALTSVTFALRGEGRYSDYSGEDLDEFRVLLMTTDGPGYYTPELRGVLAEVSADADGNAFTVKDLADADGDGVPGVLVTVDFTGHPAAADLRVGEGYAIVLDTFTGPRVVPGQDAGSAFEVGRTLDDGYAGGDAYFKSVFEQYENDTRAEHFAENRGWSRFSYSRDLRLRLEFGEPTAVDRPPVAVAGWVSTREGGSATLDASGTLDEPDDLATNTYEWDLNGDGVYDDAVGFTTTLTWDELKAANPRFNGDDRYASRYDLGLKVTDAQGRSSTDVGTLSISDAIPVLDDSVTDFAAEEGREFSLDLAATDPNADDRIFEWVVRWGDGNSELLRGTAPTATHTYADDGEYEVSFNIYSGDQGGANPSYGRNDLARTITATVANVAPVANVQLDPDSASGIDEGGTAFLALGATDPGDDTIAEWLVDWGDGSDITRFVGDAGTVSHVYADDGTYQIRTTAVDEDGAYAAVGPTIDVADVAPAVTIGGPATGSEGDLLEYAALVTDPAGANGPPRISWVILDENGFGAGDGVGATAAFVPRDNGVYTVRATVDDGDSGVTVAEKTVTVGNVDPVVSFTALPDGSLGEGEVFLFRAETTDPSRDTISTVWTVRDGDGAVLRRIGDDAPQNITGIAFAPPNEGTYTVEVVATDDDGGTGSATYTVEALNLPPVVGPITGPTALNEGEAFTFDAAVSDPGLPDTFDLAWELRDADTGAVVAASSAEHRTAGLPFEHFAPDDGNYVVTVTATDDAGASTSVSRSIAVSNLPPVVTLDPAPGGAVEGRTVRLTGAAEDPLNLVFPGLEGVTLSWTVAGPDGAEVASGTGGAIAFDPPDDGDYTVTLTAADDDGGTATAVRTVSVANVDPVADAVIATLPRQEGGRIEFSGGAIDVDADTHSYAWTVTDAAGAVVHSSDEQDTGFTPADDGVYRLTLTVTDDDGGSGTQVTDFTVDNVDPSVVTTGPLTVDEGSRATFTAVASDPAGAADPLTLTWAVTGPDGEPAAGGAGETFGFTPADDGAYTVMLTVDDGDGGVVSSTRTLSVANVAPTVTLDLPTDMAEGEVRRLRLSSVDPAGFNDERRIAFTVADAAGNVAATSRGDDVLDFFAADDGPYTVTATVDDGDGGVTTVTETLAVANLDPVIAELSFGGSEGSRVTDGSRIDDPAGATDPLTFAWTVTDAAGATVYAGDGPKLGFTPADDGVFTALLTVTDDDGGSATASETFTIGNVDPRIVVERDRTGGTEGRVPVVLNDVYLADDPGDDAAIDFTVDWGDGTVETFAAGPDGRTGPLEHIYADDGAYEILVTGRDEDGTYAFPAFTEVVSNVTPVIDLPAILSTEEGRTLAFELTAADSAGANDPQTWSWTLSDPSGTVVASGDDPFVSHTFPDDGDYSLTVTVDDGDGGVATKTAAVQVQNLAPTVEIVGLPAGAAEGDAVTATLLGTDPAGDRDPLTFAWAVTDAAGATIASGTGPDVAFAATDDGVFTLTATADDGDGGVTAASRTLTVSNVAPAVTVAVLENEPEGKRLVLGVTAADPGDDAVAAISVDWGDGTAATFAAGEPIAHSYADDGTYTVSVTVTDEDRTFAAEPFSLFVGNLDPVIRSFAGTDLTLRGREATFSGVATDPGVFDVLTATLDWGDGTTSAVTVGQDGAFAAAHTYADAADYAVTLTVDDGDGGTATATAEISVRVAAVLADDLYGGSALFVAGTAGNDALKVRRNSAGEYVVKDGGAVVGRFDPADVGRVVIDAGAGHDWVSVSNSVRVGTWIDGGAGNDYLRGGGGADVLDGGAGHDLLAGRGGRDVMIGGTGSDWLFGEADQDILIGGTVDFTHPTAGFASNAEGLKFVVDTWAGSGSLLDRFCDLAPVLERNETVLDDDATDLLVGGRGVDWFFNEGGRDVTFDNPWASIFEDDLDWLLSGD